METFDTKISLYSFLPSKTLAWKLIFHAIVWMKLPNLETYQVHVSTCFPIIPALVVFSLFLLLLSSVSSLVSLCVLQCVPSFPSPYFLFALWRISPYDFSSLYPIPWQLLFYKWDRFKHWMLCEWLRPKNLKNYLHLHLRTCLNYSFWKVSPLSHLRNKLSLFFIVISVFSYIYSTEELSSEISW